MLEILTFPNPRLRVKCEPVAEVSAELTKFAEDMLATMYLSKGIGLAAAQVDRQVRLLVIDTRPKDEEGRYDLSEMTELEAKIEQPIVLFNPEITLEEGKISYEEGCLSVPTYYEAVERFDYVEVKGLDRVGKEFSIKTDGLLSICIQHEIDHLDGKLFIDRLSTIKSNRIKSKIKKHGYPEPDSDDKI